MSAQEIMTIHEDRLPASAPVTPVDMLNQAVARGASLEVVSGLMALYERWESGQARKAFDAAVAAAKGEIPPIIKNRTVDFNSSKGRTTYQHEDLAEIARTVDPILNRNGLSYRYRASQEGAKLRMTCILSHRDGYSEETTLESSEDHSGNKNSIQAIGSAATYLQRYTLKLALGLATTADDDGKASQAVATISAEQVKALQTLMIEVGADPIKFLKFSKLDRLEDMPAADFDGAVRALNAKRNKA